MKIAGFDVICLGKVGSTNDVAAEYAQKKSGQKLVVVAHQQTEGRGRRGRKWLSLEGNLFFSVLIEFDLRDLGQLIMAASLSLLEAIKEYKREADVLLKWPNDVLLNGAKVSGMLLEKGAGEYMITGIGVNIVQSPESSDMLYPTTSLRDAGIETTADMFLECFLRRFSSCLRQSVADLRQNWLNNARGIGQKIVVRQNGKEQRGIFEGIDKDANLILRVGAKTQKILAGDVFYEEKK